MMRWKLFLVGSLLTLSPILVSAQPYPTKPIRLVIPQAVGGTTDTIAGAIAQGLGPALGTQVVAEDFAPIAFAGFTTIILVVHRDFPATTLR